MIEITLKDGFELYKKTHMAARNFAAGSRVEYSRDLSDLIAFLEHIGIAKAHQVGIKHLEAYQATLDNKGLSGSSRRRKTMSIRSFFAFLNRSGNLETDIAVKLTPPKVEDKEPRFLTEVEYKRLLDAVRYEPRDAAIVELYLQTGIRLYELCRLTLDDIQLPNKITKEPENVGLVHIQGKGRRERNLPLNYKACRALKTYLKFRPQVETTALFLNKSRGPLGPRGVQKLLKKYLEQAEIRGASVHSLRHTFGTQMVLRGANLRVVQEALGHQNLATTSIYVSLAKDVMSRQLQEHAL